MTECQMTADEVRVLANTMDELSGKKAGRLYKLADWLEHHQSPWVSVEERLPEFPCPVLRESVETVGPIRDFILHELQFENTKAFCDAWGIVAWLDWRNLPIPPLPESEVE